MKNARKIFSAVAITLLAIVMLFTLAGCGDDYNSYNIETAPMSVSIWFGESFMEDSGLKAAGVTPYEWRDYLKEENKGDLASIFVENGVVILQVVEGDEHDWERMGVEKIEELCREYAALDEECSIELYKEYKSNITANVWYNENISKETAEEYIAQIKIWCAYLCEFDYDYDEYGLLEQVDYIDLSLAADETECGISFEDIVCSYELRNFEDVEIACTFYADGGVGVDSAEPYETFTITEEQVQTIIDALRSYKVWTMDVPDDYTNVQTWRGIFFYDKKGEIHTACGGYGFASERFNKSAEVIEEILSSEYPQPTQP